MGLRDYFANRRAARSTRHVERAAKKLLHKHVQTSERQRAIELLEDAGSPEAVKALLMRFTYRTDVQIVDEDEKERAYEALLRLGERAIEPIREFIHEELAIYWPLRALTEIAGERAAVDLLLSEIESITDNFDRDLARKNELVSNLREYQDERVLNTLLALLRDESEDIRIMAIDGLAVFDEVDLAEQLVPILLVDDESVRIKQMILELLTQRRWNVKRFKRELSDKLPPLYWVDDTGVVQRK